MTDDIVIDNSTPLTSNWLPDAIEAAKARRAAAGTAARTPQRSA